MSKFQNSRILKITTPLHFASANNMFDVFRIFLSSFIIEILIIKGLKFYDFDSPENEFHILCQKKISVSNPQYIII